MINSIRLLIDTIKKYGTMQNAPAPKELEDAEAELAALEVVAEAALDCYRYGSISPTGSGHALMVAIEGYKKEAGRAE